QQPPAAPGGVRIVPTWLPKVAATCFVVVSALVLVFVYHGFRGSFTPGVTVTVESGRSGLMLEDGAMVKAHGVHVGSVTAVQQTASGAVIELRLDPDAAARLPADPGADIRATTVFGAKYVTLTDPPSPGPVGLTEGTVRSEEHTSELRHVKISYAVFCLKKKKDNSNLAQQQQVSEIIRQLLTQAHTAGQYFNNAQIKEMTRKLSAEVALVQSDERVHRHAA